MLCMSQLLPSNAVLIHDLSDSPADPLLLEPSVTDYQHHSVHGIERMLMMCSKPNNTPIIQHLLGLSAILGNSPLAIMLQLH